MTNTDVAKLLKNVAASYTILDERKYLFQILAYQKAADSIAHLPTELKDILSDNQKIPGIGQSIHAHLEELYKTGKVAHFEDVIARVPKSVFPLLDVTSIGPKKAYKLVSALKLENVDDIIEDLIKAGQDGRIAEIESFGEKSQEDIIQALNEFKEGKVKSNRMPLLYASELASKVEKYISENKFAEKVFPLGSLRRRRDTIGDIDFAVATKNPTAIIEHFVKYPGIERVIEKGQTSSSILVTGGRQVDLIAQTTDTFGSLLQHFTGSKYHNVALREYAIKKGWSLSEKGIKLKNGDFKTFKTEDGFYRFLGMQTPPPEIRENNGEIELALQNKLPKLIEASEIKGDLHIHSSYPIQPSHDMGNNSMQEMINVAKKLNYQYIGFSEHNPSTSNHTKSEIYSILAGRKEFIEQINASNKNIHILNLLEIDILPSGDLAIDDKALNFIDAAIVSIHSVFSTPKKEMTKRAISGLSHPKAKILAHPSGRLINQRSGYELDYDQIFDFVQKNNKAIEINAWPTRLDLVDTLVLEGQRKNVKFVINTDSHADFHMQNMPYGVSVARRGWCQSKDVLNTLPFKALNDWITGK